MVVLVVIFVVAVVIFLSSWNINRNNYHNNSNNKTYSKKCCDLVDLVWFGFHILIFIHMPRSKNTLFQMILTVVILVLIF